MDVYLILFLLLSVWKLRPVNPLSGFREDYLSLDTGKAIRGLLSIAIVCNHVALHTESGLLFHQIFTRATPVVAVFFFLSGYGLQKSYIAHESYKKHFLLHRLPRVLLPCMIAMLLYWVFWYVNGSFYSIHDIFMTVIDGNPFIYASWFIICIILFYIAFQIFMCLCKKRYLWMVLGGVVWYFLYMQFCIHMNYGIWWYQNTPSLLIGMLWAIYEDSILVFIKRQYLWLAPVTWASCCILLCTHEALVPVAGIQVLLPMARGFAFTASLLLLSLKFKIGNPILNFLGNISTEIYVLHGIPLLFFPVENEFQYCLVALAGSIFLAYAVHILCKKVRK